MAGHFGDESFQLVLNAKLITTKEIQKKNWKCGPMPNVMAALPNIGGALCSTPQSLAESPTTTVPCSNAAKTRNPLKFARVPQTTGYISAVSSPYCGDMWRRYVCLTSFFPIVDTCLSCKDIVRQSCAMVPRWQIFDYFFCVLYLQ